jgi:hypothetical protein
MRSRGNDVEEEPHLMVVIVVLILSTSAIAMPPSGPSVLSLKLKNEGGNKCGTVGMLLPSRLQKCKLQSGCSRYQKKRDGTEEKATARG